MAISWWMGKDDVVYTTHTHTHVYTHIYIHTHTQIGILFSHGKEGNSATCDNIGVSWGC